MVAAVPCGLRVTQRVVNAAHEAMVPPAPVRLGGTDVGHQGRDRHWPHRIPDRDPGGVGLDLRSTSRAALVGGSATTFFSYGVAVLWDGQAMS